MGTEDYKFDPEIKDDNFINTLKQKLGMFQECFPCITQTILKFFSHEL